MRAVILFLFIVMFISHTKAITPPFYAKSEKKCVVSGKNRFTTVVDGITREYYVHVPTGYKPDVPVPMVFMLHGTGGDGEKFYDQKGWTDVAEEENFIAVFPSSLRYKIIDDIDGPKTTTKWNTFPDANWAFQPGEKGADDIKFLRKVVVEMQGRYRIDASRIYLNGFSNGGQMAAKCSIEMSDLLAAVAENAGSFFVDTTYIPKRKLPVLYQVGNRDYGPGNTGPSVPMGLFDTLIKTANLTYLNGKHYNVAHRHIDNFLLQDEYIITGDSNVALTATYQPQNPGPGTGYPFHFIFVKNLGHVYPNGSNHKLDAPRIHWDWMKQYRLELPSPASDYALTVESGYGSGRYKAGDTIHIWAEEPSNTKTFRIWNGDYSYAEDRTNWHTTFIMPERDVIISAEFIDLPADLEYKKYTIQGVEVGKTVYAYFPPKEKLKGVSWFFQGGSGRGYGWLTNTEQRHFVDMLVANHYGIITMDAEDVTQQMDLNNSGELEYDYSGDTLQNPDILNVKLVKQFFIDQGAYSSQTPHVAVGFSSGGGFAEILATLLGWRASLSHNTPGIELVSSISTVPHYQNNSLNDNGPNVGPSGNLLAFTNYQNYQDRNICSSWILQKPQPLHAERFARIPGISLEQSKSIFQFIKQANILDDQNYLKISPVAIENDYKSHPENYPFPAGMPAEIIDNIFDQLKAIYTIHTFRSDYNGSAFRFIDQICETNAGYVLDVGAGYGGGVFQAGQKLHIWAAEKDGYVFSHWTGQTQLLESSLEYHTTLVMPSENVQVEAQYTALQPSMDFEIFSIKGAERNKRVYAYFPDKDKMKGVVWLFHGTNGNAISWVNEIENRQLCNRLMASDYGIIAFTCEESEFEIDFNNDGVYRWSYGIDTTLIDFGNIRAIRDAMFNKNKITSQVPHIALGFSAGGAFTEYVAYALQWKAAVNHNTPGNALLSENSTVPYYHCISENDNHPDVGPAGNLEAKAHYQNYLNRDACVEFEAFAAMPLFPERFDRSPLINKTLSVAIFNEINANNGLDDAHFLNGLYSELEQIVLANISAFPVIASLTAGQRNHLKDQIQTTNAEHHFKADFNGRTIAFIENVCFTTASQDLDPDRIKHISIQPNPASEFIYIHGAQHYEIYHSSGRFITKDTAPKLDISHYDPGLYFIKSGHSHGKFIKI